MQLFREDKLRQEENGYVETPEEADDFYIDDDAEHLLFSKYELSELQEETPIDLQVPVEESPDASKAERDRVEPDEDTQSESPTRIGPDDV